MRFAFIEEKKAKYAVSMMCRVFEVSRQGFYQWCKRPPSSRARQNVEDARRVREAYVRGRRYGGYRTVYRQLQKDGQPVGKHRTARLMRQQGLFGRPRKRYRTTTNSSHDRGYAPNLLNRAFQVSTPDTVWLADITYVRIVDGWLYLAAVLDLSLRKIVGWAVRDDMPAELTTAALQMAIDQRRPPPGLVHHSDRGVQYASGEYRAKLEQAGMVQSMSRKGNCWDNAPMESFFGTLKRELIDGYVFKTKDEAVAALFEYIEVFYNRTRLHSAIGYMPPAEYEERLKAA